MPLPLLLCFCICLAYKSLEIVEKRNQIARLSSKSCLFRVAVQHAEQGENRKHRFGLVISCTFGHVMSRPFWWAMPLLWKCPTRVVWLTSSPWRPLLLKLSEISREQRETACDAVVSKRVYSFLLEQVPLGLRTSRERKLLGPMISHKLLYMFDALNEQLLYIRGVFKMSFLSIIDVKIHEEVDIGRGRCRRT